jgi:hypothetical protein
MAGTDLRKSPNLATVLNVLQRGIWQRLTAILSLCRSILWYALLWQFFQTCIFMPDWNITWAAYLAALPQCSLCPVSDSGLAAFALH